MTRMLKYYPFIKRSHTACIHVRDVLQNEVSTHHNRTIPINELLRHYVITCHAKRIHGRVVLEHQV